MQKGPDVIMGKLGEGMSQGQYFSFIQQPLLEQNVVVMRADVLPLEIPFRDPQYKPPCLRPLPQIPWKNLEFLRHYISTLIEALRSRLRDRHNSGGKK